MGKWMALLLTLIAFGCSTPLSPGQPLDGGMPATAATTSTPESLPPAESGYTPSSKKGVILPGEHSFCQDLDTLNVGWYYRNEPRPAPDCPVPDPRFVPRLTNAAIVTDEALAEAIKNAHASGWLIGFVEPNLPWWSHDNIPPTPLTGARNWRKIEEAALPVGIRLVSPSPSQHEPGVHDDYGHTWLWAMVDAYEAEYGEKPHFDALGWNFYSKNPANFQAFFMERRNEALAYGYDVPFWILEYAGDCWNSDKFPTGNEEVVTRVTPSFENTPWIARYVWFANRIRPDESWAPNWHSCSLIDPDTGELTELGKLYAENGE
ncbi:MAG: hypothetical protein Kow0031_35970 [Anaerolineae bacterium]